MPAMAKTAAFLIIGNEILTGKIQETNLAVLARELFALGIRLRRVLVCPDEVEVIASDLEALRREHDFVFTSGGVGPTHDDVTLEAVARCFDRRLRPSAELEARIRESVGERFNEGHRRMTLIPEGARLLSSTEVRWPTVMVENVFVLPGLPEIFRLKMPLVRSHLAGSAPFCSRTVYTLCRETELAETLRRIAAAHPEVAIGSYPVLDDDRYRVRLTFDGSDSRLVDQAVQALLGALPADRVVDLG